MFWGSEMDAPSRGGQGVDTMGKHSPLQLGQDSQTGVKIVLCQPAVFITGIYRWIVFSKSPLYKKFDESILSFQCNCRGQKNLISYSLLSHIADMKLTIALALLLSLSYHVGALPRGGRGGGGRGGGGRSSWGSGRSSSSSRSSRSSSSPSKFYLKSLW